MLKKGCVKMDNIIYLGKSRFETAAGKNCYNVHFCINYDNGSCNTSNLFCDESLFNKMKMSDCGKKCKLISSIGYKGLTLSDIEILN